MQKYSKPIFLLFILTLLIAAGCSDRGTNLPTKSERNFIRTPQDFKVSPNSHDFDPELAFQVRNQFRLLEMAIYIPDIALPPPYGPFERVPLLILLPPQDGDQFFYFNHGLQQISEDLIASGEIKPMIICCVTNDKVFGGYFYAGHFPAAGDNDALYGNALVRFISDNYPVFDAAAQRGIGGVGMGAYGAFRAAIMHPGTFTSITTTDGPFDFDGVDGNTGLINLFDDALAEQGLDASTFKSFDSSGAWPISRMFIGGGFAFTPHDTAVTAFTVEVANIFDPNNPGSFSQVKTILIQETLQRSDSTTLISGIVRQDPPLGFHLPFDGNGNVYPPIWNVWLDNNLDRVLAAAAPGALAGVDILIATTPEARFDYHDQTLSWINTLTNSPNNYPVTVNNYSGYDGNPATHDQYLYKILRDILIFHSNNFNE